MKDNTEKCIICGYNNLIKKSAEFVPFLKERMFHNNDIHTELVTCPNCGISYSSYRPNDEEMANLYVGYRDEHYQKTRQKYEPEYTAEINFNLGHSAIEERKYRMEDFIKSYIPIEQITNVLDYGGDKGQFIPPMFKNANKFVYDVSNIETETNIRSISDFSDLKNYNWDFIMCCHVLEHVANPMDVLEKIKSILPTNGYLYIELPYEDYYKKNYDKVPIHEHINFFSNKVFDKVFNDFKYIILLNSFTGFSIHVLIKKIENNDLYNIYRTLKDEINETKKLINELKISDEALIPKNVLIN